MSHFALKVGYQNRLLYFAKKDLFMKSKEHKIIGVVPESIAEQLEIKSGDVLLDIDGNKVTDILDYRYLTEEEYLVLNVRDTDGEEWSLEIEKGLDEELGLVFDNPLIDKPMVCKNKCIFCFMDQLPEGTRASLHLKDDDYRLSFLEGNYITLTNVDEADLDRVIYYKLNPINVSVHTTNPELRVRMLKNPKASRINDQLKKLIGAGIIINAQIVLCKNFNDGIELDRTIKDLVQYYPKLKSISVVPVGLTKHRERCEKLQGFDTKSSKTVIEQVSLIQRENKEKYGSNIVYLADEFYISAGMEIPEYSHYEDFPQIENGVGMIAQFTNEFNTYLKKIKKQPSIGKREVSIVTGKATYNFLCSMVKKLEMSYNELKINIFAIENNFFGPEITVTGLLTGGDIIKQLKGKALGQELFICEVMLKHDEDVFLDDVTLEQVEKELGVKVRKVKNDGKEFIDNIIKRKN